MALDTRIALGVQSPQFADPLEQFAKAQGVRNLLQRGDVQQQEQQINAEELKKVQAANHEHDLSLKEDAALQALWEKHGGKPDAILKEAGGIVRPKTFMSLQKSFSDERAARTKLKTDELPISKYQNEQLAGLTAQALALPDEEYAAQWANIATAARQINPDLEIPEQPIPKKDLGVLRLRFMTGASLDNEEDERRKKAKEVRDVALSVQNLKKAEQDAIVAEQEATGTKKIQPAEQARIDQGEQTPDYKNFLLSKKEGFAGTFEQWQTTDANRRKSNVSVYAGQDIEPYVQGLALGQLTPMGVPAAIRDQVLKSAQSRGIKVVSEAERDKIGASERMIPIVQSIEELSQKINTGHGVLATISGAAEKAKAKINLDDDVAEYQALVESFTPLVARALGHTGVLTQQDVDSTRAIFPKPTDSKSLRDRKITRLKQLLTAIKAKTTENITEPIGGTPGTPKAPVKQADPLGIR